MTGWKEQENAEKVRFMEEKQMAEKKAETIIKKVVDLLSEKRYEDVASAVEINSLTGKELREQVEGYLKLNGLSHIDGYDIECKPSPNPAYKQLNFYYYNNGSGFHVDYDLSTNAELNDLTLQMEFLYSQGQQAGQSCPKEQLAAAGEALDLGINLKARILDIHVM